MPRLIQELPDPLSLAIAPPKNETEAQKRIREEKEEEARQVSRSIDDHLKAERLALRKAKKPVKVLLLGQSHAGKSTILKNFQIAYNHNAWLEERISWKAVIYLNLLRTINTILDVVAEELSFCSTGDNYKADPEAACGSSSHTFNGQHKLLAMRLGPLRQIQADLQAQLGSASADSESCQSLASPSKEKSVEHPDPAPQPPREFSVQSGSHWKGAFKKFHRPSPATGACTGTSKPVQKWLGQASNIIDVIVGCKQDIKVLWRDPAVQYALAKRKLRLEDTSGFFLDDVDRLASHGYEPSDYDVVRARLRTNGVQEYRFSLDKDRDWIFYDFCGSRSFRSAWCPYFDDVHAIIFLAPLSPFDEYETLPDGSQLNRLQDSFQMWKVICSSKLLSGVHLILFMNKCDQLSRRLKTSNVLVKDHISNFKDRTNDYKTATNYFRSYFKEIHRKYSPMPREFFAHFTTAVDTKSTSMTLGAVKEAILMNHLKDSDFL